MKIKIHQPEPPKDLLKRLERVQFRYTNPVTIFHFVCLRRDCCGVVGDGDNGAYEFFILIDGELQTSDSGFGSPETALRAALELTLSK
jgi:hypothetical protein